MLGGADVFLSSTTAAIGNVIASSFAMQLVEYGRGRDFSDEETSMMFMVYCAAGIFEGAYNSLSCQKDGAFYFLPAMN